MIEPFAIEPGALTLAGIRTSFIHILSPESTSASTIPALWGRYMGVRDQLACATSQVDYGLIWCPPKDERSHPDELQYMACAPVTATGELPDGFERRTVPESMFAKFRHVGSIEDLADTIGSVYREWLPQSGHRHSNGFDVEVYDERFKGDAPDSVLEYWIPVEREGA